MTRRASPSDQSPIHGSRPSLPLGKTPDALVADLDVLDDILSKPAAPELAVLEQLVPVKHPDLLETL